MATRLQQNPPVAPPVCPDTTYGWPAKPDPRNPDTVQSIDPLDFWQAQLGHVLAYACREAGLSHKEAAALMQVDDAEFGKQVSGNRRVHVDRALSVRVLRQPFLIGLARACNANVAISVTFGNYL